MPSYSHANMHFEKTEHICKFKRARKKQISISQLFFFLLLCVTVFLTKSFQLLRLIISEVGRRGEMALKCLVDMFVWLSSTSGQNFSLLDIFS